MRGPARAVDPGGGALTARLIIGDVFDALAELDDGTVDLVLTSPPFLAQRSYLPPDHPDKRREIGAEPTPAAIVDRLLEVTAELGRVLAPHGSIVVEFGDTYAGSGGAGGNYQTGGIREGQPRYEGSGALARRMRRSSQNQAWRLNPNGTVKTDTPQRLGESHNQERWLPVTSGPGWPQPKSLCLVPEIYRLGLAYGINPLTGAEAFRVSDLCP